MPLATTEPQNWLDSLEVANIVGQQEVPSEIDSASSGTVARYSSRQSPNDHLATMEWFVDALSGRVALERFRVHSGDALAPVIRSRHRRRTKVGGWEEFDPA